MIVIEDLFKCSQMLLWMYEKYKFEEVLTRVKNANGYEQDSELNEKDLFNIVEEFKAIYKKEVGREFPMSVKEQLMLAIEAVF